MISIKEKELTDFNYSGKIEWLEANGIGGYASSTLSNAHSRRYHGLLVAASPIPTGRTVLVSKMDETILKDGKQIHLGSNRYENAIFPEGYKHLTAFQKELYPEWTYQVDGITLRKSLIQVHGKNTTLIRYEVLQADSSFQMYFQPFLAARDYHSVGKMNTHFHWDVQFQNGIFHNRPYGNELEVYIQVPNSNYHHHPEWYLNLRYEEELNRGLEYNEDLICHGDFEIQLNPGDTIFLVLSTENPESINAEKEFEGEVQRRLDLLESTPRNPITDQLVLAADQFLVERPIYNADNTKTEGATVIAGYPWFTDWGRDTMISLPGLCISTRRFNEAKKIIKAFAQSVDQGMLPNFFSDKNGLAEFNNADGTLWYFQAIYHYNKATQDKEFVLKEILPVLENIIEWHFKGTRYNIYQDPNDHLLFAGERGQQLTWMDARIGDWVVTPRMGKPVEIQALWYNALCILDELFEESGDITKSRLYSQKAGLVKESFEKNFWFEAGQYLYDGIDENNSLVETFRPNQLFAISLPFPIIGIDKAKLIMEKIKAFLYTPVGIRSLTQNHPQYRGYYGGDQFHRDSTYHQGTVWSWLLGPYIDALVKIQTPKEELKKIVEDFSFHFSEGGIGTISEIFDGDNPHEPKGCFAQAWSVAELLRVIVSYKILD